METNDQMAPHVFPHKQIAFVISANWICFNQFQDLFQSISGFVSINFRICFNQFQDLFSSAAKPTIASIRQFGRALRARDTISRYICHQVSIRANFRIFPPTNRDLLSCGLDFTEGQNRGDEGQFRFLKNCGRLQTFDIF